MAKQLNVNLAFTADTAKAKAQIQELQTALNQVSNAPLSLGQGNMTKELQEASIAATQLKNHIQEALNADTGTLDFSKLNASFKKSGVTMSDYAKKIASIGPTGQQALAKLATAVNQAEVPIKRSNAALGEMLTTLKNTARWQLSSSILHEFMGAVQSAYGYAQDLNESLNNIRIVTGYNTEQMAAFAEQANKAARALSATTTEYTDASLIYFQQGDSIAEATKKADITIKMANVVGQNVQTVSNQLTALWNNFDDGSKSLEYYADVLTALGAATASSSDEIAAGLEKFAAIGETIGLSYEYAAAALATITSNTRQSEEVVGTALKTIFARIQGLKMGETLEDGLDLNKYSAALQAIGVSIFEQSGELKKMDDILDETAQKWEILTKKEQIALAQTVAGVRQYTQFVALMDNWNNKDDDSMVANLKTANNAIGTLQEQADIYAESWEAAQDRVQASLENVYNSLIDDDFFIGILDGISDIVDFVDRLIDSLGGLGGVLTTVSAILMRTFSDQLAQKLRDMAYNISMSTAYGREKAAELKNQEAAEIGSILSAGSGGEGSLVGEEIAKQYEQQRQMQQELARNQENMSKEEIADLQQILDIRKQIGDQIIQARQKEEEGRKTSSAGYEGAIEQLAQNALDADDLVIDEKIMSSFKQYTTQVKDAETSIIKIQGATENYQNALQHLNDVQNSSNATEEQKQQALEKVNEAEKQLAQSIGEVSKQTGTSSITVEQTNKVFEKLKANLRETDGNSDDAAIALGALISKLKELSAEGQANLGEDDLLIDSEHIEGMVNGWRQTAQAAGEATTATNNAKDAQALYEERLKASKAAIADWAKRTVDFSQGLMSMVSIINSAKGAIDTLTNPDASGWEKFSAVLMSFCSIVTMTSMMVTAFQKALKGLNREKLKETITTVANTGAEIINKLAVDLNRKAREKKAQATRKVSAATDKDTKENYEHAVSEVVDKTATDANSASKNKLGGSLKKLGGSFKNLAGAAKNWISAHAGVIGGIGLIAAGVAVAVGAIAWGINQYNKYENAAKEAAIQAEKAAEAYRSVAQAYSEFTSNLDAYKNAKNGLEGLTEGTTEFKSAVLEANEAAMELLNTYEGLSYTVDENGLININEESLKMVQEQEMKKVENAQNSSMLATQNAKSKQLEADSKQFQRDNLSSSSGNLENVKNTFAATGAGAGSGALIGAGIGSIVPVIGTAVGAVAGAIIGGIGGLITGIIGSANAGSAVDEEEEALEKLAKVYEKEGNARFADDESFKAMLQEQGITDSALVDSLVANRESTMELVAQMSENSAAISEMNEQMINSEFGDKISESFKGEDAEVLANQTSEAMGSALEKRAAELYEDEYKDQFGGKTDADIQKAYAEAMGWDVEKTDNKSGNKATYYDKDGNVVAEDLSDEVARQFLAQQAALKELESSIPMYTAAVQSLADAGNGLGEGIGTAIASFAGGDGGNLNTLTSEQVEAVSEKGLTATKNGEGQVISFSFNGETFDDEKAKTLGYESAQAFYDAFSAEIKRVENAWDDIELDFKEAGLDPEILGNLSLEAAQKFQSSLEQMNYGSLGDEGSKAYVDGIQSITESLNMGEADVADFISQIGEVDWSNWYAMEDVDQILQNMGYDLDLTTAEMQEFINTMREVGNASPVDVLERTWQNAEILADSLSKGIEPGSVLDEQKYQALIESNGELEDSFMQMMDGTYKYVGSETLDFDNALDMGGALEQTREMSKLYEAAKEDASKIDFAGLSTMDYVSSEDLKAADSAISSAQSAYNKAEEDHSDGFLGFTITTDEEKADLDAKQAAIDGAKQNKTNLSNQRSKDLDKAKQAVQAVMDSEYLKDVAEYNGWTEEQLNSMLEGIKNGDDAAMEQMKGFATEMNKFMAAGDEGLYDISAAEEKIASTATSIDELDELTERYSLSTETYGKAITGLFAGAAAEAKTIDELNSTMQKVVDAGGEVDLGVYHDNVRRLAEEGAGAVESLDELQKVWSDALATGAELDYSVYADNLLRIAENYEICADEAQAFQIALQSGNDAAIKAAEENLEATIMLGEAAEKYGVDQKELSIQSKQLAKQYGLNAKQAAKLTIENQRMNKGVEALVNNWEDWKKELNASDKTSRDWAKAAAECTSAIADLVGASEDLELPNEFFDTTENMALLEKAARGDADAINLLGIAVATAQIEMISFSESMRDINGEPIEAINFFGWQYTVSEGIDNLKDKLAELGEGLVGQDITELLGGDNWINALNEMAIATGMSVEQMNSILNSLGVQAEVEVKSVKQMMNVPTYTEVVEPTNDNLDVNGDGVGDGVSGYRRYTIPGEPQEVEGYVQVAQIKTADSDTGSPKITYTGNGNVSNSAKTGGKSGGGGNKKTEKPKTLKPTETKKKDDEIERYFEITETIDDLTRALDEASAAKDELWGPDRINAMNTEGKALGNLITAHKKYQKEIAEYDENGNLIGGNLKKDKDAAAAVGATFDESGRINNYDELMGAAVDTWNSNTDSLDARAQQLENERARIANMEDGAAKDAAQEKYDADMETLEKDREANDKTFEDTKEALSTYTDTLNLSEEAAAQLQEYIRQMQQIEYEKTMYKVEFKVEVDERALKVIEHKLKRLEDDFFKSAEAMAMIQSKTQYYDKDQFDSINKGVDELKAKFEAGEITQAQYIEGLGKFQDMAMENVDALYEMNDAMKAYYSDTLDAGMQKIKDMTQHFDHLSSRLQHYQSIVNLMGHEQNYEVQNKLLQGQIEVLNNKIETAKSTMAMLQGQLEQAKQNYANATTEEEKENWRQRIVDINNALMEEEDAYLGYVEEVGDAANQILTNSIEKAFKDVEDQMTNNLGFDSILKDMDRMNTLTDEFLTNTNKMYETNKMIANAQSAIDKTSNLQAKQQYQHYIEYIEQLQIAGNLTQTELEVAQARYKVLEAEMALEEAKEAKSTVRLTRDAEGNFGYVYTADQGNVDNAQQNYLDAQNELYNIGLETTNEYREKIVNLQQQTLEDLKQLEIDYRVNHLMSEEEYEQQKAAIMETSQETLKTYQEQFNLGQFTMATTSYSALMQEDINFQNGQLSSNKEHHSLMESNDSEYYNGIKTTAETTQTTLEENLAKFNVGVLSAEDAQYLAMADKDTKYYTGLKELCSGIAADVNGIFNTNEDSLSHELTETFYNNLNGALDSCKTATEKWKENMSPLVEAVGVDFDGNETKEGLSQKIANTTKESKTLSDYLNKKPGGLIETVGNELTAVQKATLAWEAHWKEIQTVIGYYENLITTIGSYIEAEASKPIIEDEEEEEEEISPPTNATLPSDTPPPPSITTTPSADTGSTTEPSISTGESVTVKASATTFTRNGGNGINMQSWVPGNKFVIKEIDGDEVLIGDPSGPKYGSGYTGWVSKYDLEGFLSGGYTGSWGPEGKLALLHQKELVLNKQDTENFLTATQILREISDMLDHNALVASLGAINLGAMTIGTPADQILQQEVTIHADFPNVTDHNEIELAIDNLINAASQHAFKS